MQWTDWAVRLSEGDNSGQETLALTSCLGDPAGGALTPDPHGAVFSARQDLGLAFPHAHAVHVVRVTLQDRLNTCATCASRRACNRRRRARGRGTDLERSVLQVQDVDVVVSRPHDEAVVLGNHRGQRSPRSKPTQPPQNDTHSGVEDHGVDLRDLQAGPETGPSQRPGPGGSGVCRGSPVVGPLRPRRLDVLQKKPE